MRIWSRGLVGECRYHAAKSHYHRQTVVQLIGSGQQCHLYREETGLGLGLSPVEFLRGHLTSLSVDRSHRHTLFHTVSCLVGTIRTDALCCVRRRGF